MYQIFVIINNKTRIVVQYWNNSVIFSIYKVNWHIPTVVLSNSSRTKVIFRGCKNTTFNFDAPKWTGCAAGWSREARKQSMVEVLTDRSVWFVEWRINWANRTSTGMRVVYIWLLWVRTMPRKSVYSGSYDYWFPGVINLWPEQTWRVTCITPLSTQMETYKEERYLRSNKTFDGHLICFVENLHCFYWN